MYNYWCSSRHDDLGSLAPREISLGFTVRGQFTVTVHILVQVLAYFFIASCLQMQAAVTIFCGGDYDMIGLGVHFYAFPSCALVC